MIVCGCAVEAQYQLKLLQQREHKPLYITDRIGKYTRRRDKRGREKSVGSVKGGTETVEQRPVACSV